MDIAYERITSTDYQGKIQKCIIINEINKNIHQGKLTYLTPRLSIWFNFQEDKEIITISDREIKKSFSIEFKRELMGRKIRISEFANQEKILKSHNIVNPYGVTYQIDEKLFYLMDHEEAKNNIQNNLLIIINQMDYENIADADIIKRILIQFAFESTDELLNIALNKYVK